MRDQTLQLQLAQDTAKLWPWYWPVVHSVVVFKQWEQLHAVLANLCKQEYSFCSVSKAVWLITDTHVHTHTCQAVIHTHTHTHTHICICTEWTPSLSMPVCLTPPHPLPILNTNARLVSTDLLFDLCHAPHELLIVLWGQGIELPLHWGLEGLHLFQWHLLQVLCGEDWLYLITETLVVNVFRVHSTLVSETEERQAWVKWNVISFLNRRFPEITG